MYTSQAMPAAVPWVACTPPSCNFRCSKTKSTATRAGQHDSSHTLSRRALQSELLAALLVTACGWRPDDALAKSQQGIDSAEDLDLTITDKVSLTAAHSQQRNGSAANLPSCSKPACRCSWKLVCVLKDCAQTGLWETHLPSAMMQLLWGESH